MSSKKLYRSQKNKMLAGICGGLGEYFDVDATLLRLVWLLVVVFTGIFPGVIVYVIAIFVIPLESSGHSHGHESGHQHTPND